MRHAFVLAALALIGCRQGPADPPASENVEVMTPDTPQASSPDMTGASATTEIRSVYTPLDTSTCSLIEENKDEGPYWRRRCPGAGAYSVEWTESDLRQGLELVKGRARTDVELSSIVAKGAFNRLGPRLEWRGKDTADPDSLIVRVLVANEDSSRPDRSLLAVAKLRPTPCVVAVIAPGPRQNEEARRIADGGPQHCMIAG